MKKINFSQLVDIIDMSNASIDPYLLSLPSPKLSYSYLCAQGVCVVGYYIGRHRATAYIAPVFKSGPR